MMKEKWDFFLAKSGLSPVPNAWLMCVQGELDYNDLPSLCPVIIPENKGILIGNLHRKIFI